MNGGYFARLAQRATGAMHGNGASPTSDGGAQGRELRDALETTTPAAFEQPSAPSVGHREVAAEPRFVETRIVGHLPAQSEKSQANPLPPSVERPGPADSPPTPVDDLRPPTAVEKTVERTVIEHKTLEEEVIREWLQPPDRTTQIIPTSLPAKEAKEQEINQAPPQPEMEKRTPIEEIGRALTARPGPPQLEPPTLAATDARPTLAEAPVAPRLVIGQMRVEVIPVTQQTTQPVKAVRRPRERAPQPEEASHSRLRFGLGQM